MPSSQEMDWAYSTARSSHTVQQMESFKWKYTARTQHQAVNTPLQYKHNVHCPSIHTSTVNVMAHEITHAI